MIAKTKSKKGSRKPNESQVVPTNSYATTIEKALGFSRSRVVKLRYCQQVTLSPSASSSAYIVYAANGPFSPNIGASAGTGYTAAHQPKGWDQWSQFYDEYVVTHSSIKVTCSPPNSTTPASAGGLLIAHLSDVATPYATVTSVMEDGKARYKQFNPNTSSFPATVTHNFDAVKFWRLKDIQDNQKNCGAVVTANPSELAYFIVMFFCNDTSVSTSSGPYCYVTIDYTILMTGPSDLIAS